MIHRTHVEAIDRTFRDLRSCDKLMGGLTFVFIGNFRPTLPVIPKGTRADIIKTFLKSSLIWRSVSTLIFQTNTREQLGGGNTQFLLHLFSVNNGTIPNDCGIVSVNSKLDKIVTIFTDLISNVYLNIDGILQKPYSRLYEKAIITSRNISTTKINNIILDRIRRETKEYRLIDAVVSIEDAVYYPQELLNSHNPAGFPPHNLQFKV